MHTLAVAGTISDRERGFAQQVNYWRTIDAAARRDRDTLSRLSSTFLLLADSVLASAVTGMTDGGEQTVDAWRAAVRAESRLVPFAGPPDRVLAGEEWMASLLRQPVGPAHRETTRADSDPQAGRVSGAAA